MKKILFIAVLLITITNTNAQKTVFEDVEAISTLPKRELIVVLEDENSSYVQGLRKKLGNVRNDKKRALVRQELENALKANLKFARTINKRIKELVPKYWTLNSKIIFKTSTEVQKLSKMGNNKYAVLYIKNRWIRKVKMYKPVIIYTGSESETNKIGIGVYTHSQISYPYYMNFLANINYNFGITISSKKLSLLETELREEVSELPSFSEENLIVSMMLTQAHVKSLIKSDKRTTFNEFAVQEAKKNCTKLKGKDVFIQKAIIYKKILDNPSQYMTIAKLKTVSAYRIKKAILNKEDVIIAFPIVKKLIPIKVVTYTSGSGNIKYGTASPSHPFLDHINVYDRPISSKMYYNAKTGEIVGYIDAKGMINAPEFMKRDFKLINKSCK